MAGRAGRKGIDEAGEAVMIVPPGNSTKLAALRALITVSSPHGVPAETQR